MKNAPGTWKIATIRGVDLKIHISLVFLMLYVVLIASMQFPRVALRAEIDPYFLSYSPITWGVIFALGLLISVTLHEFGHVLVAQAQGVKVRGITLMMLGGASEMEKMPERRYAEFKLAIIGPLVSFAIATVLLFIHTKTQSANHALFCYWLGTANLALGIFNLLPAFPLDGGRALRSLLAARNGMLHGTQTAVRVSKIFAWLLAAWGLWTFNILLIFIAFYVYSLAQSELILLSSRRLVEGLRVSEVMTRAPSIAENTPLIVAAQQMLKLKASALPVSTLSHSPAVITLDQLRSTPRDRWSSVWVKDVKEESLRVLNLEDSVSSILSDLLATPSRTLPVQEGQELIGVVCYSDLDQVIQFRSLEEPLVQEEKSAA